MTAPKITSPQDAPSSEVELDSDSLNAIRSILTEEDKPALRQKTPQTANQHAETAINDAPVRRKADAFPPLQNADTDAEGRSTAAKPKRSFSLWRKSVVPKLANPKPVVSSEKSKKSKGGGNTIVDRFRAYRPTPVHIGLAVIALIVLTRPWLVLGLLFLSIVILTGVFLITGYDGFWQGVVKISRWYANRRPTRAAAIHARLDRFAVRWDSILDRFPEGTVDALYLPDFGDLAQADARHGEALERRLAGLNEKGA
ncbi:MAG: hypothetical protein V7695_19240 [Sulfitobacter sp.]